MFYLGVPPKLNESTQTETISRWKCFSSKCVKTLNWWTLFPHSTRQWHLNQCRSRLMRKPTEMCRFMHLSMLCRRGGRQGMGWGFDCLCWPWGRAFDWSCSPRGGDIWIFLRPTWRYLTADSDEKDWDRTYVSRFHASRMRRTVWKDQEVKEANENKRRLSAFHCFVFKFPLF